MLNSQAAQIPFGAVYFRKSNPPSEDWERDYAQAKQDGMNLFRHWFMWGNIEVKPGVYDWADYDRQMELGEKYGIKTIIAEHITFTPDWLHRSHNHLQQIRADGSGSANIMNASSATGGSSNGAAGSLDLNFEEARELAGKFLRELVLRYKDHPAMYGYDVWNECNYPGDVGYSTATVQKFREWLQIKYKDLSALGRIWKRYSYADWDDIMAPTVMGPYPECMDWLQFKKDNFYEQMQWRIDVIRSLDRKNRITAHGTAASLNNMARGSDDWLASSKVESYGFTWVTARKGSEPWKQAYAVDLVRGAARGKTFWHSEMQGGPLWLQSEVIGRPKEDARVVKAEDVRIWNLISLARGARGILYLRWRSLLDGPLFGAFGLYDMNGLPNPRSEAAAAVAEWANNPEQGSLLQSVPVQGDIGIVIVPETQMYNELMVQAGKGQFYTKCVWGAYRGFFDNHIRADWVLIDHIDEYRVLYLPYPVMLTHETADKLREWVSRGGKLISEGCPAYFGDHGRAGVVQPTLGLDELFGATQDEVEFMPDLGHEIRFQYDGKDVNGGLFLQSYTPTTGQVCAHYTDGRAAAVENQYGAGKTLLIGTFPSEAYFREQEVQTHANTHTHEFFRSVLAWSGKRPTVQVTDSRLQAIVCEGSGGLFLWVLNPSADEVHSEVAIDLEYGSIKVVKALWGEWDGKVGDQGLIVSIPAKDAVILQLENSISN
jgi:beta-galactosidase